MNDNAYTGPRDPVNAPCNQAVQNARVADAAEQELLRRVKVCLHRWASRYAGSTHSQAHVKETLLLEQEIDDWLLRQ